MKHHIQLGTQLEGFATVGQLKDDNESAHVTPPVELISANFLMDGWQRFNDDEFETLFNLCVLKVQHAISNGQSQAGQTLMHCFLAYSFEEWPEPLKQQCSQHSKYWEWILKTGFQKPC